MLHLQLLEITSAIPHHQPNTRHSFFVSTRTFSSNSACAYDSSITRSILTKLLLFWTIFAQLHVSYFPYCLFLPVFLLELAVDRMTWCVFDVFLCFFASSVGEWQAMLFIPTRVFPPSLTLFYKLNTTCFSASISGLCAALWFYFSFSAFCHFVLSQLTSRSTLFQPLICLLFCPSSMNFSCLDAVAIFFESPLL